MVINKTKMKRIRLSLFLMVCFFIASTQNQISVGAQNRFEKKEAIDPPVIFSGKYLTGIDFPIGAVSGSLIRMNGKAERQWWQIFNNFE